MAHKRKFFVGGNWKCNGTVASIKSLVDALNAGSIPPADKVEVVVAPTYVHLSHVKGIIRPEIAVSAQDIWYEKSGAFTGAISADQVKDLGLNWTIIGHSERRSVFKDTDEIIAKKTKAALDAGLHVIACIGELLSERKEGKTLEVCLRQLEAYKSVVGSDWSKIVIAYEPVWAIGTGVTASPEQAEEVHAELRKWLKGISDSVADTTRILYGGSVTAANAAELASKPNVDGFLVGGASLKGPDFLTIINSAKYID
eukprot:tig00001600_g9395.t1